MYTVRDAVDREVFKLVKISERVLKESPVYTLTAFDKEKSANYIYGAIMKQPGWFLRVIANDANEPVGGLLCLCTDLIYGPDKVAYDITIMIDEEHRGKCLPQLVQIVNEYKEWALEQGAKIIKFGVSSGINIDHASVFFERMGFARIGAMHGIIVGA